MIPHRSSLSIIKGNSLFGVSQLNMLLSVIIIIENCFGIEKYDNMGESLTNFRRRIHSNPNRHHHHHQKLGTYHKSYSRGSPKSLIRRKGQHQPQKLNTTYRYCTLKLSPEPTYRYHTLQPPTNTNTFAKHIAETNYIPQA